MLNVDSFVRRVCRRKVKVNGILNTARAVYIAWQMTNMYFLADSLVMRFVKDHFDEYRESTIGGKHQR